MPEQQWSSFSSARPPFRFTDELTTSWMLVTSGKPDDLGTMTVSWGGSGFIWNHDVVFLVIRESRNTLSYLKKNPTFSLTLFDSSYHDKLYFCGRNSGRDTDKIAHCSFTPLFDGAEQTPYFDEARYALICRQLFRTTIEKDGFLDLAPQDLWEKWYNTGIHTGDKHQLIIASIEKVLSKGDPANG
ncbi:flavin reductase family protein [Clostridiaceae bacterium]|nr:flavin reductase family protein [Clostridiaceae bacterium]RKI09744.1 flavin reductase family protein [bacterium 1XD21-70]